MGAARRTASLVVVARSARALAQAAQRAGFAPYVVDLFGDSDTRASAVRYRRCPMRAGFEFEDAALLAAVADFGRGRPPLVWGGGLEGRPDLLAACARHCEVLGTAPALLPAVIAPETRARRLRELGIATPDVAVGIVPRRGTWVRKRCGEAGGAHVRYAQPEELLPQGHYAQRWIAGDTLSVSFLASRRRVAILGYAAQLFAPTAERPFVWAGAIGGVEPPRAVRDAVAASLPGLPRKEDDMPYATALLIVPYRAIAQS